MILIKSATEEHMSRILEIERDAISPPWTHDALLGEIYKDDSYFVVAVENTTEPSPCVRVVGFVVLRQVGDDAELLQVAVDRSARRRGVADMLMDAALEYAKAHLYKSMYLEVRNSNKAALALYSKHSFSLVRRRKAYYTNPVEDALVMSRDLM